jgi:hypothetical protein
MPLTNKQRVAFFRLATTAYSVEQPDEPFDAWRKSEMLKAGLPNSLSRVSKINGFDSLMLHFAILAQDDLKVSYYEQNEQRLLLHILLGLTADVFWLSANYAIGQLTTRPFDSYTGLTVDELRISMFTIGNSVDDICAHYGVKSSDLPSAGRPFYFRGKRAAVLADKMTN